MYSVTTIPPLAPGTTLGSYELTGVAGTGAWGRVYRAHHRFQPNWQAAAKELIGGPAVLSRFEAEADLLMHLEHPRLPRVYDYVVYDSPAGPRPFIIMEWLAGAALSGTLHRQALSEQAVVAVADGVLEALEYLHSRTPPILHRDVKSDNIMVAWQPGQATPSRVWLVDLGIACFHDASGLRRGTIAGTEHYGSPQQLQGLPPEPPDDLFGLAATLYEASLGPHVVPPYPFIPATETEIGLQLAHSSITPTLQEVISRGLRYERADRWPSATAMRQALHGSPAAPAGATATTQPLARGGWNPLRSQ